MHKILTCTFHQARISSQQLFSSLRFPEIANSLNTLIYSELRFPTRHPLSPKLI